MKNNLIVTVLLLIIVGAGAFVLGMKYQQRKLPSRQFARNGQVQGQANRQNFRPVNGEIMAADEKSVTVKLTDGSSKIIILADSTKINKTTEGSKTDLQVGEQVMVVGTEGSDGTVTAQTISVGSLGGIRGPEPGK